MKVLMTKELEELYLTGESKIYKGNKYSCTSGGFGAVETIQFPSL